MSKTLYVLGSFLMAWIIVSGGLPIILDGILGTLSLYKRIEWGIEIEKVYPIIKYSIILGLGTLFSLTY